MLEKRKVTYAICGENDRVLKEGECFARYGEYEIQDILDNADINFDDMWSLDVTDI